MDILLFKLKTKNRVIRPIQKNNTSVTINIKHLNKFKNIKL